MVTKSLLSLTESTSSIAMRTLISGLGYEHAGQYSETCSSNEPILLLQITTTTAVHCISCSIVRRFPTPRSTVMLRCTSARVSGATALRLRLPLLLLLLLLFPFKLRLPELDNELVLLLLLRLFAYNEAEDEVLSLSSDYGCV